MVLRKNDRRVNRTRRQLKDALLALILEKGYDGVTVEDITERADLGRTTFYLHYKDKEELLLETVDAMIDDLMEQIAGVPLSAWRLDDQDQALSPNPILLIFIHAAEHGNLYRVILRGEGAYRTGGKLREMISSKASEFLTIRVAEGNLMVSSQVPLDVFSHYFAGALLGFLNWWLESRVDYTPQAMAEMFQRLFIQGAVKTLGASVQEE